MEARKRAKCMRDCWGKRARKNREVGVKQMEIDKKKLGKILKVTAIGTVLNFQLFQMLTP